MGAINKIYLLKEIYKLEMITFWSILIFSVCCKSQFMNLGGYGTNLSLVTYKAMSEVEAASVIDVLNDPFPSMCSFMSFN